MKWLLSVLALSASLTDASAQGVNLSGRYQCITVCRGGGVFAFVTQNGWELNIVNEAGEASRAWVDYPGHLWVLREDQGAIYSPDGITIQFDRGTLWQRAPEVIVVPPPRR
jgi:hypothetical protein